MFLLAILGFDPVLSLAKYKKLKCVLQFVLIQLPNRSIVTT